MTTDHTSLGHSETGAGVTKTGLVSRSKADVIAAIVGVVTFLVCFGVLLLEPVPKVADTDSQTTTVVTQDESLPDATSSELEVTDVERVTTTEPSQASTVDRVLTPGLLRLLQGASSALVAYLIGALVHRALLGIWGIKVPGLDVPAEPREEREIESRLLDAVEAAADETAEESSASVEVVVEEPAPPVTGLVDLRTQLEGAVSRLVRKNVGFTMGVGTLEDRGMVDAELRIRLLDVYQALMMATTTGPISESVEGLGRTLVKQLEKRNARAELTFRRHVQNQIEMRFPSAALDLEFVLGAIDKAVLMRPHGIREATPILAMYDASRNIDKLLQVVGALHGGALCLISAVPLTESARSTLEELGFESGRGEPDASALRMHGRRYTYTWDEREEFFRHVALILHDMRGDY